LYFRWLLQNLHSVIWEKQNDFLSEPYRFYLSKEIIIEGIVILYMRHSA